MTKDTAKTVNVDQLLRHLRQARVEIFEACELAGLTVEQRAELAALWKAK